jgi:hypothetical protein
MTENGDNTVNFRIDGRGGDPKLFLGFESEEKLNECLENIINTLGKQYNVPISKTSSNGYGR